MPTNISRTSNFPLNVEYLEDRVVPVLLSVGFVGGQLHTDAGPNSMITALNGSSNSEVSTSTRFVDNAGGTNYQRTLRASSNGYAGERPQLPNSALVSLKTEIDGSVSRQASYDGFSPEPAWSPIAVSAGAESEVRVRLTPTDPGEQNAPYLLRVNWGFGYSSFGGNATAGAEGSYTVNGQSGTFIFSKQFNTEMRTSGQLTIPMNIGVTEVTFRFRAEAQETLTDGFDEGSQSALTVFFDIAQQTNLRMKTQIPEPALGVWWNTDRDKPGEELARGLDFRYAVDGAPVGPVSARFYYARGEHYEDRIRFVGEQSVNGLSGISEVLNEPARWSKPPADATHILVVLDEDNLIPEPNEPLTGVAEDNVAALRLHSAAEILVPSSIVPTPGRLLDGSENRLAMTAKFLPGYNPTSDDTELRRGLTMSEAEVALGVDHFNWVQQYDSLPPGWELHRRYPNQRFADPNNKLSFPAIDPDNSWGQMTPNGQLMSVNYIVTHENLISDPSIYIFEIANRDFNLDEYEYYLQEDDRPSTNKGQTDYFRDLTSPTYLAFSDTPFIDDPRYFGFSLFHGGRITFTTKLVGVDSNHRRVPLGIDRQFSWTSDGFTSALSTAPNGGVELLRVGGTQSSSQGAVSYFTPDGTVTRSFTAFPGFTGEVRVASADFNGDGVRDVIAATGPGGPPEVALFDGVNDSELFRFPAFETSFRGGVYVSSGDVDGDGVPDLIVSAGESGGPRVRIFSGADFHQIADFFGIEDPATRIGARTSVADITGDGILDLIVGAAVGGGSRIAVWDGKSLIDGAFTQKPFPDFFAFESTFRNGVFVTAADLDGDGYAELITGAGPDGGPRIRVLSGVELMVGSVGSEKANFFGGDPNDRNGARVTIADADGDGEPDLIVGTGVGGRTLNGYSGRSLVLGETPVGIELGTIPDGTTYVS